MKKTRFIALILWVLFISSCISTPRGGSSKEVAIPKGYVRLNYTRFDKNYTGWGLHAWGDGFNGDAVKWEAPLPQTGSNDFGVYWDIPYNGEGELNFIIHKGDTKDPDGDRTFPKLSENNEYWAISGDTTTYTDLKTANSTLNNKILSAVVISENEIVVKFRTKNEADFSVLSGDEVIGIESITDKRQREFTIKTVDILDPFKRYRVVSGPLESNLLFSWKSIDSSFSYNGELGALYNGNSTEFKLWSPLASSVVLNLYTNGTTNDVYKSVNLELGDRGVWSTVVKEDLKAFFYTYDVTNLGKTKRVLDPYAKSMAAFNEAVESVGRAAIVDLKTIGPKLSFANIAGYEKREDAIIWEIHVRDFTSDPSLNTKAQFGTYKAFIEKLDYIKSLGVTHVQLLPVMNYYFGDELNNKVREGEYSAKDNTYNWGYDPHNYFTPEGMYSQNPQDPELRVQELKELINAIHGAGMGVILDAVYNHTAKMSILEDLVPGYYHFMDSNGKPKSSYGGGRVGSTHAMSRKLIVDSVMHWVNEYKVDGFRYDLMGDLDAETVQIAYDSAKKVNPNILMIGEGWRTYAGDDGDKQMPADQDWMDKTEAAGSFSDEMRNELKSGYGSEGQPRFMTGGKRNIELIFQNVIGKPSNMKVDQPGDVVQYVAAHDNLPLHDVIAQSIKKDPDHNQEEIQKRIRLTNTMILTSQGTAFLHAGQEYGRTKQWRTTGKPEDKGTEIKGFDYPWFVHDSYDSSDAINMIDWTKIESDGLQKETINYTRSLIELRKSTNAFRLGDPELVSTNCQLVNAIGIEKEDNAIIYMAKATNGDEFYVIINADSVKRSFGLNTDLTIGEVVIESNPSSYTLTKDSVTLEPLTAIIVKK
ncbi:MAG: pullulanase [Spirochaetales bacterium]|nr:pullulanase [Spirochaetales bacterium]